MPTKNIHSKQLTRQLRALSLDSRKIIEEYGRKHFEYISYKDFCRLLKDLEDIASRIDRLYNDQAR